VIGSVEAIQELDQDFTISAAVNRVEPVLPPEVPPPVVPPPVVPPPVVVDPAAVVDFFAHAKLKRTIPDNKTEASGLILFIFDSSFC
jgi:hypothetical protein